MLYHTRLATAEDEPFLYEMLYYAANMADDGARSAEAAKTNQFLLAYLTGWGRAGDLGIVAETVDGQAVGAAWLRRLEGDEHRYANVDPATPELAIAVHPSVIGKGVGTLLLDRLFAQARGVYPTIVLSVREANPARRLYERVGFRMAGEVINRVGGRSFVMVKTLSI